ncbi:hypothetical protein EON67_08815, partial [archaeon]
MKDGAVLDRCIIGAGACIGTNARLHDTIVLPGARVGDKAQAFFSIIGALASVGPAAVLHPGVVVGAHCPVDAERIVASYTRLAAVSAEECGAPSHPTQARLWPQPGECIVREAREEEDE